MDCQDRFEVDAKFNLSTLLQRPAHRLLLFMLKRWESPITGPSRVVIYKIMQKSGLMRSLPRFMPVKLLSANPQGFVTQSLICHAHAQGETLLTHQNRFHCQQQRVTSQHWRRGSETTSRSLLSTNAKDSNGRPPQANQ